jgi:hypothetical protein
VAIDGRKFKSARVSRRMVQIVERIVRDLTAVDTADHPNRRWSS